MKSVLLATLIATPALADCPAGTDHSAAIADIVARMQAAQNEMAAQPLAGDMWEIWLDAPDEIAQAMLDEGLTLNRYGDMLGSRRVFSRLIDYCPDYAEGYNQRAFAAFLSGDYEAALVDLDAAIALQPVHLGALTGKVMTLIRLDRNAEAQEVLRTALSINPWLSERALLDTPPGEDI